MLKGRVSLHFGLPACGLAALLAAALAGDRGPAGDESAEPPPADAKQTVQRMQQAPRPEPVPVAEREVLKRHPHEGLRDGMEPDVPVPAFRTAAQAEAGSIWSGMLTRPPRSQAPAWSRDRTSRLSLFFHTRQRRRGGADTEALSLLEGSFKLAMLQLFSDLPQETIREIEARVAEGDSSLLDEALPVEGLLAEDLFGDENPFEAALNAQQETPSDPAPDAPPVPAPDAVDAAVEEPAPEPGTPPAQPLPWWARLSPLEGEGEELEGPFPLLAYGDLSENGSRHLFRATRRTKGLVLEDARVFDSTAGLIVFVDSERVLTGHLNEDAHRDVVITRPTAGGTLVRAFFGTGGWIEQFWSGDVPGDVIGSALFDVSGDGRQDLVFLVRGLARLLVYEGGEGSFRYRRELALPFAPALLLASLVPEEALHVLDGELSRVVTFSARDPERYREGPATVMELVERVRLEANVENSVEALVLEYGGRMTLVESYPDGLRFRGSFLALERRPLVIFGFYFDDKEKQILLDP